MLLSIPAGSTSKIIQVPVFDSSSTVGAMLAGLVYNSAGLTAYYNREGAAGGATAITLATATKGTWATGGFVAVDGTNMPGWYELDIPDAALAAGAKSVSIHLKGATNMVPVPILIELTATSNQDAVRGGMTALPNAAAEAAGGLYTRGTGAGQIAQDANGNIRANVDTIKTQAVTCAAGVTVLASVGTAATSTAQTGDSYARIGAAGAGLTSLGDTRIANLDAAVSTRSTYAGGAVASVTAGVTVSTNNDKTGYALSSAGVQAIWDALTSAFVTAGSIGLKLANWVVGTAQTGDAYARLGAPAGASVSADIAAVNAKTTNLPAAFPANFAAQSISAGGVADANVVSITGDTGSAAKLKRVLIGNVTGTVGAASTTTSIVTSALNPSASVTDQYKGRIVTFDDATSTAALRGQSTDITGSSNTGVLTVTALTNAPVSGDTFTIS